MNILIIGGTGLISTAVAQQAVDRGHAVTLLNRGQTPVRVTGDFRVLTGDRSDRQAFERLLRESGLWDCVIDMIGFDPADAASLASAIKGRTAQLVFCSTTNVYPKPADQYPVREDHRLGAAFKGGTDKIACEAVHREAEAGGHYRVTVIRPGHAYGETGPVLHSLGSGTAFLDRIRRGKPVIVHGDGQGLWSALHAEDIAQVFAAAAGNPVACGRTYNATGVDWMTWDQYHARVAEALGVACPERVHVSTDRLAQLAPDRTAQVKRSLQYPGIYDMAAARQDLGFTTAIPFVDGMRRTIRWLGEQGKIEPWESDPDYDRIISACRQ